MKLKDWSIRRWLLVIAAIILLPLVGLRLQLKWQVRQAIAELKADGFPVSWEELDRYYDNVPEDQNAGPKLTNVFSRLPMYSKAHGSNIPVLGPAFTPPPGEPWPEPMRMATREYLASMQDSMSVLYKILELPDCRYVREFRPRPYDFRIWWAPIKATTAKLSLECLSALDQNDWVRAASANEAQFKLADTLYAEPELVGQLIRNALAAMALDACQRLLGADGADPQALKSLQRAVQAMLRHTSLRHAIIGERVQFLEWVKPGNDGLYLTDAKVQSGTWRDHVEQAKLLMYRMVGLADQDILWYLNNSQKLESLMQGALHEQQEVVAGWARFQPANEGMRFCFWSTQMMANNDKAIAKHVQMHTKLRATYAALAVAQYQLQYEGKLPASLQELVPEFLEAVPVEPQSEKPFELIVTADGYGIGRGTPVFKVKVNGTRPEPLPDK